MVVAQLRDVKFKMESMGPWPDNQEDLEAAQKSLEDVSEWLGYSDDSMYCDALDDLGENILPPRKDQNVKS